MRVGGTHSTGSLGVSILAKAASTPGSAGSHLKLWWDHRLPREHPRAAIPPHQGCLCQARGVHWSSEWWDPLGTRDGDGRLGTTRVTPCSGLHRDAPVVSHHPAMVVHVGDLVPMLGRQRHLQAPGPGDTGNIPHLTGAASGRSLNPGPGATPHSTTGNEKPEAQKISRNVFFLFFFFFLIVNLFTTNIVKEFPNKTHKNFSW